MPKINEIEIGESSRSEEVKDIIERMPDKFGTIVAGFITFLTLMMLFFGSVVKYPDVVKGDFSLNSSKGPVKIIASISGTLKIIKRPKSNVKEGELIGYLQNPAKINDVYLIDSLLHKANFKNIQDGLQGIKFPENVSLGELSEKYFTFLSCYYEINNHYNTNLYNQQQIILEDQAIAQKSTIAAIKNDIILAKSSYELSLKAYRRDSILFANRVISQSEFEKTKITLLSAQRAFEALDNQISTNKYQLESALGEQRKIGIQRQTSITELKIKLSTAYYSLIENIKFWKIKYAFISPIDGILQFSNFWTQDDHLDVGQEVFSVIPSRKDIYAQVLLPELGAGKVHIGQKTILKLNDFPYNEYGSVEGKIKDISLISNQNTAPDNRKQNLYLVRVELPKGLLTNYGTILDFKFGAKGTAEIITTEKRLFLRLFDNLKYQAVK